MELDRLIDMGLEAYHWFLGQPLPLQIVLGIGLLSAGYFLLVVLRMLVVALLVTFRGL
jgi:hypothetical protein